MTNIHKYIFLCLLLVGFSIPTAAEQIVAINADRAETVTSGLIENGIIIIRDGKISAIGADVDIPVNANVIDARDKTIFPGLVNPSSVIGLSSSPGGGPASNPHYRVADELYPFQDAYKRILEAGFTTLGLVPRGNGITGQGAIVRPTGNKSEEMIITESGLLMIDFQANERAKKVIRDAFESAKKQMSSTDPKVQPLVRALQGEIPTFVRSSQPGEILHLLELLKSYDKMKLVFFITGSENYLIATKLAEKK
ncbi:MAG: amidohydrolase family protein, partial [Planctomycetota bacterium]